MEQRLSGDDRLCETKCNSEGRSTSYYLCFTVAILWWSEEEALKDSVVNKVSFLNVFNIFLTSQCSQPADADAGRGLLVRLKADWHYCCL